MFVALLLLFIVVPLVEIVVIVQVANLVGGWNAVGLLLLISIAGAALVKHEGFVVMRHLREQLDAGRAPTNELIDGALLLIGGLMMLTPGFVTDAFGLLLVFPLSRVGVRTLVRKRFAPGLKVFGNGARSTFDPRNPRRQPGDDDIIDV